VVTHASGTGKQAGARRRSPVRAHHRQHQLTHLRERADPLTGVALLLTLLPLVAIAVSRLLYPYDAGCYEANIWAPARLLLSGANPYNLDYACQPPYIASTYGPAYYAIIGVGLKLFGLQLWFGRAVSIAAAVAAALCLARIAFLLTGSARLAALAAIAFCAQFPLQDWIAFQRPDILALAFSLSGMLVALRAERSQRIPLAQIALSAALVAAATLCRQTAVLPILVVGFVYARHPDRRALPAYAIVAGLLVIIPHVLTNVTSHGGYLQQAVLIPGSLPKKPHVAAEHLNALAQSLVTWLLFAVLVRALWHQLREHISSSGRNRAFRPNYLRIAMGAFRTNSGLIGFYFLASAVMAVVTSSIPGSNVNYFLETCAAASLLVALAWPTCEELAKARGPSGLSGNSTPSARPRGAAEISPGQGPGKAAERIAPPWRGGGNFPDRPLVGASGQSGPVAVPEGRRESSPAPSVLGPAAETSPVPSGRLTGAQGRPDAPLRWYRCLVIALAIFALPTGARIGRGEYARWQSLGYYREVVSTLRQYSHQGEPCFSVYPELATSAGQTYYFNTETPYDGRSPQLATIKARVFASGILAAAVTHSSTSPPGYHQVRLSHPVPTRFYPVFLHIR
jgi:hypothetical protein